MRRIEKQFTYPIWDEWRTNSFTQGRTGTHTYKGPEFITVEVNKDPNHEEYGKESGWCLTLKSELERPTAEEVMRITVDCKENPLLCEIANDEGREDLVAMRRGRTWKILWDAPDGYPEFQYTDEVEPRDVYDEWNIYYDFENDKWNIGTHDWEATGVDKSVTWQDVRDVRDRQLHETDSKVGQQDAPQSLQDEWLQFRTRLRDLPAVMEGRGYEPWQAMMMFPSYPKDMRDPVASSDPADPYRDGAFAIDVEVHALRQSGKKG